MNDDLEAFSSSPLDHVIVGGGIAGLYCALKLAAKNEPALVLEALDRLGGRIETHVLDGFPADFGPMRFETVMQPLFTCLAKSVGVKLVKFHQLRPEQPLWPKYDLLPDEQVLVGDTSRKELTSLQLLRLGILRLLQRDHLSTADADAWLDNLSELDYEELRKEARFKQIPLRDQRFWNVLTDVLSPQAVMKIRDIGSFYHLIPENPNAIEWIIFWLRALKPSGQDLKTVHGGVQEVTKAIERRLRSAPDNSNVTIFCGSQVTSLSRARNGLVELHVRHRGKEVMVEAHHVVLALPKSPLMKIKGSFPAPIQQDLDSVFGFPLLKVFFVTTKPWWTRRTQAQTNASLMPTREVHYFRREERKGRRDDGHGMVLLYMDRPSNEYWSHYVLKPVHDRAELDNNDELVTQFSKYLASERRVQAERAVEDAPLGEAIGRLRAVWNEVKQLVDPEIREEIRARDSKTRKRAFRRMLTELRALEKQARSNDAIYAQRLRSLLEALAPREYGEDFSTPLKNLSAAIASDVIHYGIRDWGREPFGAACHAWKVHARSWEVRDRLASFKLDPRDRGTVHICGEAYSDYQGFIEGALRSAKTALDTLESA